MYTQLSLDASRGCLSGERRIIGMFRVFQLSIENVPISWISYEDSPLFLDFFLGANYCCYSSSGMSFRSGDTLVLLTLWFPHDHVKSHTPNTMPPDRFANCYLASAFGSQGSIFGFVLPCPNTSQHQSLPPRPRPFKNPSPIMTTPSFIKQTDRLTSNKS